MSQNDINFNTFYIVGDQEVEGLVEAIRRYGLGATGRTAIITSPVASMTQPCTAAMLGSQTPFQEDTRGPFTSVSHLQVADGVVAFVAGIPPSGSDPAHPEFRYTTYDPAKKAWQMRSWSYGQIHSMSLATKDGVVVFIFTDSLGNQWLWADIYDPPQGTWGFGGAMGVNLPQGLSAVTINDATVEYLTPELSDIWGYTSGVGWHAGRSTDSLAYFVARPTSGPAPLCVWFTDMSIGLNNMSWNFGDGSSIVERSPSHYFTAKGTYVVSLSINAGTTHYERTINVGGGDIAPLLPLLLNN